MAYRKNKDATENKIRPLIKAESSIVPGIRISETKTSSLVGKTNIPGFDYVINPYIGCSHKCEYCYAAYMDTYDPHPDTWGSYIDARICDEPLNISQLTGKSIFIASITDPYNPAEKHFRFMRKILDQTSHIECSIEISTKSKLVLRDIDLLKCQSDISVFLSLNTLDETFRSDMDFASSVEERLETLRQLHEAGIKTGVNISPIFPELTDPEAIVDATCSFVDCYMFEDLKLRYPYKKNILNYIKGKFPHIFDLYEEIYIEKDRSYFEFLKGEIEEMCTERGVDYIMAFGHGDNGLTPRQRIQDDPFGGDSLFKI
jgi:DNA repair photolyase